MFEDQTYDVILDRMKAQIPDDMYSGEGSFLHDALSPAALEFSRIYAALDFILEIAFVRTATGDYLTWRAAEKGVNRRLATKAIRKGVFNVDVPIGSRFQAGDVIFTVTEKIGDGEYRLEAETPGTVGNRYAGELTPLEYIEGLESAMLTDVIIAGRDEETDEELRERYFEEINAMRYGGNIDQYREWISNIAGVGRFRVEPLWNGRGTVRAVLTDASNGIPSQELIDLVQNTLDPYQDGKGNGLVPVGHVFTAMAAVPHVVNVEMTIEIAEGYGVEDIQGKVEQTIRNYFSEINFQDPDFVQTTIRHTILLSRLVGIEKINDILSLKLNDVEGNLTLAGDEIAQLGTVTIHVQ